MRILIIIKGALLLAIIGVSFMSCSSDYMNEEEGNTEFVEKEYYGTVILSSQIEIDEFGAEHYTTIYGSVYIRGEHLSDDITDLSPLESISYIRDDLWIDLNDYLVEINEGLNNIETIEGGLYIRNNPKLKRIDGLSNLENFSSKVVISENPELENISGLNKITSVSSLEIRNCQNLHSITGFKNLTNIDVGLSLIGNTILADLDFLKNINNSSLTYLRIEGNTKFTQINDLTFITETDELYLSNLPNLQNIGGLVNVGSIHSTLALYQLPSLLNIDGLSNVTKINGISIYRLDLITNLNGLSNIETEVPIITITKNESLRDFCALQSVPTIEHSILNIFDNFYNPTVEDIINGDCSI